MQKHLGKQTGVIEETMYGIVDRVTFHNPENGWTILRVLPFNNPHQQQTVIVHQTKAFAGATMEIKGAWTYHKQYGRQFHAIEAIEKKPATTAALEKYLGSGMSELHSENLTLGTVVPFEKLIIMMFGIRSKQNC